MRPAKLFMYTTGSWPRLNWASQSDVPITEDEFAEHCIKASSSAPFAGWILDIESDMVYGACLPAPYKMLLSGFIAGNSSSLWSEMMSKSMEGAMSVKLTDFAVALTGNVTGTGKDNGWGLLELEAELQSERDYILSSSVADTPITNAMHHSLEAIKNLKEELTILMLRHSGISDNTPVINKAPASGFVVAHSQAPASLETTNPSASIVVDNGTAKDRFIKAPHYQGFFKEYQWIEVQQGKPHMRQPGHFLSALHMQVDKYLDRLGRKDDETQEMRKACFYLGFMIMYAEEGQGNCVRVHEWLDALCKKNE